MSLLWLHDLQVVVVCKLYSGRGCFTVGTSCASCLMWICYFAVSRTVGLLNNTFIVHFYFLYVYGPITSGLRRSSWHYMMAYWWSFSGGRQAIGNGRIIYTHIALLGRYSDVTSFRSRYLTTSYTVGASCHLSIQWAVYINDFVFSVHRSIPLFLFLAVYIKTLFGVQQR